MQSRRFKVLFAALLLTGIGAQASAVQLKIATVAPDGSFWMNEVRRGGEEIAERTDGRVKVRLYPGGSMGNDQAVLRKMRIGQLHGGMVTGSTLSGIAPAVNVYSLPLVFKSYDEVDYVRQRMDPGMITALDAKGYVSFGLVEGGFAYILSNKPTKTLADLKGRKAWTPEGDIVGNAILEAAGVAPVPLPLSDVLTGLQTGLIDTVAGPPVAAVALQWFTRAKYFTDKPILYAVGGLIISQKAFNKLSEGDRAIVRDVMVKVSRALDKGIRKDNQSAREALRKQGVEFIPFDESGMARWHEVGDEANRKINEKGDIPAVMVDELKRHLEAFRSGDSG